MSGIEALSKMILLDPVAGMKDPKFKRLRAEDPELEELHPLARAVALVRANHGNAARKRGGRRRNANMRDRLPS